MNLNAESEDIDKSPNIWKNQAVAWKRISTLSIV